MSHFFDPGQIGTKLVSDRQFLVDLFCASFSAVSSAADGATTMSGCKRRCRNHSRTGRTQSCSPRVLRVWTQVNLHWTVSMGGYKKKGAVRIGVEKNRPEWNEFAGFQCGAVFACSAVTGVTPPIKRAWKKRGPPSRRASFPSSPDNGQALGDHHRRDGTIVPARLCTG
jgi:hypothetical protein